MRLKLNPLTRFAQVLNPSQNLLEFKYISQDTFTASQLDVT
jgi:hypothetical protein